MIKTLIEQIAAWLVTIVHGGGYTGVFAAMLFGNMLVPIPVELIMIPAGYLVEQHQMNFWKLMGSAIAGDLSGSLGAYYLAYHFGRRVLISYGKHLFFGQDKIEILDRFFSSHGEISTLTGRLVPGLRHFMAIPAGLSHMDIRKFIVYTGVGGGLWTGILIWLGYLIGDNKALVRHYLTYAEGVVALVVTIMIILYIKHHRKKTVKDSNGNA